MTNKSIHHEFTTPLFRHEVHFLANCSFEELAKAVAFRYMVGGGEYRVIDLDRKTEKIPDPWAFGKGFRVQSKDETDNTFWLWVKEVEKKPSIDTISVITHETFHVACEALKYTGVQFSTGSEEVFAYLQEEILCSCLNALKI